MLYPSQQGLVLILASSPASLAQATSLHRTDWTQVRGPDFQGLSLSGSQSDKLQFFLTHFSSHLSTSSFPLQLIKSSEEKTDNRRK